LRGLIGTCRVSTCREVSCRDQTRCEGECGFLRSCTCNYDFLTFFVVFCRFFREVKRLAPAPPLPAGLTGARRANGARFFPVETCCPPRVRRDLAHAICQATGAAIRPRVPTSAVSFKHFVQFSDKRNNAATISARLLRRRRCAHCPETSNSFQNATGLTGPRILRIVSLRRRARFLLKTILAILASARTGRGAYD